MEKFEHFWTKFFKLYLWFLNGSIQPYPISEFKTFIFRSTIVAYFTSNTINIMIALIQKQKKYVLWGKEVGRRLEYLQSAYENWLYERAQKEETVMSTQKSSPSRRLWLFPTL